MKIKVVLKNLNLKKKLKSDNSKNIFRNLELLWAGWGQFSFR